MIVVAGILRRRAACRVRLSSLIGIILLISAGCTASQPFASLAPAWSPGRVIAQVRSSAPPALGCQPDGGLLLAWSEETTLYTRLLSAGGDFDQPASLTVGSSPWDITLVPGTNGEWHVFWRDFDAYTIPRLYSAHLDPAGRLLRGPLAVSPEGVGLYRAMPGDGGTAVVIWASPDPQPDLYGKAIDAQGRPGAAPATLIARRAEFPALTRTAGGTWILGWLAWPEAAHADSASRVITLAASQAPLPWENLATTVLGQLVLEDLTTYVETFTLGLDRETGYLFTSLRNAATQAASTTVRPFAPDTLQPRAGAGPVEFPAGPAGSTAGFSTGFNTGEALSIPAGAGDWLAASQPAPAPGQHTTLPVAFAAGDSVMIGYFYGGRLAGYQPVIGDARPLGPLSLAVERDLHLILGWASRPATDSGSASLVLSGTGRPILRANPDTTNRQTVLQSPG